MKKISYILSCILLLNLSACDLDRYPYDSIVKDAAFQSIDDATSFNNALYAHLRGGVYGLTMTGPDIQSDLFHSSVAFGNRRGSVYRWDFTSDDYDIRDLWSGPYSRLADVNNFLDNVDKVTVKTDAEKATLDNFKGEAYLLRAYYHHQLVKRYAKDYEPATAATDLGVPLVLTFDVTAKPKRASIQEVYDQVLVDLAKAKELITTEGVVGSNRITKDCVPALEARVYLEMHRYSDAVTAANSLINGGKYSLVNTLEKLEQVWVNDATDESIFMLFVSNPDELSSSTNNQYLQWNNGQGYYAPDFIPEKWVVDLYDNDDIRKDVYLGRLPVNYEGSNYQLYLLNKYRGNPELYDGTATNYQQKVKVFRIAEAHLIKIEALAWDGQDDQALAALNILRTNRGLNALSGLTGDALKKEIQNERTRELLAEGTRLDDLKRWKLDLSRGAAQDENTINPAEKSMQKTAGDAKFVWAIPSREIITNPNLEPNPGWGSN
ncbi:MAG: RagB/SusD family nutrient uptake outer membrane protein [Prevotellaceae bacterium]|jgi:hypothetical protein|nr:RagB/SusD family nutrient uptake outer membrane protein [Prevotellaceae bacterium]